MEQARIIARMMTHPLKKWWVPYVFAAACPLILFCHYQKCPGAQFGSYFLLNFPFAAAWLTCLVFFFFTNTYRASIIHVLNRGISRKNFLMGMYWGAFQFAAVALVATSVLLGLIHTMDSGIFWGTGNFLLLLVLLILDLLILVPMALLPGLMGHPHLVFVGPLVPFILGIMAQPFMRTKIATGYTFILFSGDLSPVEFEALFIKLGGFIYLLIKVAIAACLFFFLKKNYEEMDLS
ncbi:MAG: hypothetical protein PHV34_03335 [Verrucomicrobiae bacterium]|nr:hypothetical protein [Verrucomicrobiae bacterium]